MRTARANRLARQAFRLRADGSRGPRARLAWRTLTTAAERHDRTAITALREAWLRDPRDDTWQDVGRWYPLAEVLAAAVSPDRSAESRAALGAFCLRYDLLPDHDNDRALFFVLTGHRERYEALDPDGTLLAAAYQVASEATREVLRHTMTALGELDVVREVVVKSPAGLSLFGLPGGELVAEVPVECREMLALGNSTFLYLHTALHAVSRGIESTSTSVHRCVVGRARETLLTDYGGAPRLGGLLGGFVVQSRGTLHFGTIRGPWTREAAVERTLLATEPTSGRLAFGGPGGLVLTDAGLNPLTWTELNVPAALFCGPDRLLTNVAGNLESWQRDGTDLARTATTYLAKVHGLTPVPAHDRVVITADDLIWLDAGTLTPVSRPAGTPRQASWFSPDGSLAVVHHDDSADVHDVRLRRLVELASRPLAAATPADLETVGTLANLAPPAGELVALLRMGLEHRFGADVALGAWAAGGADDVALGGG